MHMMERILLVEMLKLNRKNSIVVLVTDMECIEFMHRINALNK
jgi:hypothetical protein